MFKRDGWTFQIGAASFKLGGARVQHWWIIARRESAPERAGVSENRTGVIEDSLVELAMEEAKAKVAA